MQKTMKRTLALILAVVLCFSAMPFSAFAVEMTPDETPSSQAPASEAPAESSQPEPSMAPEVSPKPGADATPGPDESPKPTATPEAFSSPSAEPSPNPAEPADPYETELAQVDAQQIWPALQRAKARAAAGVGTGGVLQMGYYCFKSEVGTLTTLGEYVSQMPAKTMLINGTNVAAYCLEHEKGATGGTPYTWTDMSVNAQDTVGTIMALGFQWSAADFWTGPSDNGDKWAVTQLLIWETISGHAFMQGNGLFGVEAAVDTDMEKCAPHAYNPAKFLEYYRDLKKRLNDYMKVGTLYLFSVPRGYTDGFNQWCKQIIALCLTAFLQTTLLFLGLLTFNDNMLLGLGVMLAAGEVPRIAQQFGLDSSVKVNMMSVVHASRISKRKCSGRLAAGEFDDGQFV